jgi:hypothetical protein
LDNSTFPDKREIVKISTPKFGLPRAFDINGWPRYLPEYFTRLILGATFALKTFTVISTYLIVLASHLGVERNPITDIMDSAMGTMSYMLCSSILVCLSAYILYRRASGEIVFPFIFGLFVFTVFDASIDASTTFRLIFRV